METHTTRSRKKPMMATIGRWGRPVLLLVIGALFLTGPGGCPKRPEVVTPAPVAVAPPPPAPAPPAPVVKAAPPQFTDVFFTTNKTVLRPEDKANLDGVIKWLKANPDAKIALEGYADERGTVPRNQALSDGRANVVRDYLVAGGISPQRITAKGHGAVRQFAPGNNEAAWALNRRTHLVVTP
ncbi:MAG: OmpA family protein [candidate division NC10 bacterium]|nr:OmpA family protein [candidate division NC10 bacterium]